MKTKTNKKTIIFPMPSCTGFVAEMVLANGDVIPLKLTVKTKKIKPKFKAGALRIVED